MREKYSHSNKYLKKVDQPLAVQFQSLVPYPISFTTYENELMCTESDCFPNSPLSNLLVFQLALGTENVGLDNKVMPLEGQMLQLSCVQNLIC